MSESQWTAEMVEARLIEAAEILMRMPRPRVQGFFSLWPQISPTFDDLVGQKPQPMSRPTPSPAAIDRAEQTLDWFKWLEPADVKLVWARAEGTRWKNICWQFGLTRATANRRFDYALSVIAWRLNGRRVPGKRSRQFVVEKAKRGG